MDKHKKQYSLYEIAIDDIEFLRKHIDLMFNSIFFKNIVIKKMITFKKIEEKYYLFYQDGDRGCPQGLVKSKISNCIKTLKICDLLLLDVLPEIDDNYYSLLTLVRECLLVMNECM